MVKTAYRGVERHEEVDVAARRDDVRGFWRRLSDRCETPGGTLQVFSVLAFIALALCMIPGAPEIVFMIAALLYSLFYRYKRRAWDMPLRVPAYLERVAKRRYRDASTGGEGQGLIYLGREYTTGQEVWATPKDVRTHRLVIGTTGSGKTEEMLGTIHNSLMLDSGTLMIDGKADPKIFDSIFRLARLHGREEDLLLLNYIMGGRDLATNQDSKRSNTYNPLSMGSSAMKAELMISLLDSGSSPGSDMWQGRAISFLEGIMPPLSFLAEKGYLLFNPRLLCQYFILENIENLVLFGVFVDLNGNLVNLKEGTTEQRRLFTELTERYCGNLLLYLENLPGYGMCRPERPHRPQLVTEEKWRAMSARNIPEPPVDVDEELTRGRGGRGQDQKKQQLAKEQARAKVLEQHGYITMQLVRATGNLTFNYGHVYNEEVGEINFRDIYLNRRFLVVLLPALERAEQSMAQLGKMAVASVKGVLATLLDTPLEGARREIIEGRPSNAEIPFNIICDEYGYYVVKGFAVAPAQARSYGASITFGVQDYPSLVRANREEGEATFENTNLRHIGRMTGGESSETFKKLSGAAGSAYVQSGAVMSYRRGRIGGAFEVSDESRMEKFGRLSIEDLNNQADGEFTLIIGRKGRDLGDGRLGGGVRVVRYLAYYTGDVPATEQIRLVHYVAVKHFSETDRKALVLNEVVARAIRAKGTAMVLGDMLDDDGYGQLEDDILARFAEYAAFCDWRVDDDEIDQWLDNYAKRREEAAADRVVTATVNQILAGFDGTPKRHRDAVAGVLAPWAQEARDSLIEEEQSRGAGAIAHAKTLEAQRALLRQL